MNWVLSGTRAVVSSRRKARVLARVAVVVVSRVVAIAVVVEEFVIVLLVVEVMRLNGR